MEFRQIEHAVAVAEHGSFRRAADALYVTQPTLTRSIQSLEQVLGLRLFDRSRRGVVPTDAGRAFIARAKAMLVQRDDLAREMSLRRGAQVGEMGIGAGPYTTELNVAPALAKFIDAHPAVRVHVIVDRWNHYLTRLHQREIDLFIGELSELGDEVDLAQHPLRSHQGYFVTRAGHPLTRASEVTSVNVLSYPLVMAENLPDRITSPLHAVLGATGSTPAALPAVQTDSTALMRAIVAASNAVGIFVLTMVAGELRRGEMAVLPLVPSWMHTQFGIVRLAKRTPSPAAEHFMQLVKAADEELTRRETELARELLPSRRGRTVKPRKRGARAPRPREKA